MDKALAWEKDRVERCSACGTRREDWVEEDGLPKRLPPYEPVSETCYGCAEVDRLRKHIQESDPEAAGVFIRLMPLGSVHRKEPDQP